MHKNVENWAVQVYQRVQDDCKCLSKKKTKNSSYGSDLSADGHRKWIERLPACKDSADVNFCWLLWRRRCREEACLWRCSTGGGRGALTTAQFWKRKMEEKKAPADW